MSPPSFLGWRLQRREAAAPLSRPHLAHVHTCQHRVTPVLSLVAGPSLAPVHRPALGPQREVPQPPRSSAGGPCLGVDLVEGESGCSPPAMLVTSTPEGGGHRSWTPRVPSLPASPAPFPGVQLLWSRRTLAPLVSGQAQEVGCGRDPSGRGVGPGILY